MKRTGGVTAAAVIALVGSIGCVLLGLLTIVSQAAMRNLPPPQMPAGMAAPAISPTATLLIGALFYFGFGAWGISSAIGLLRLRNWARLSFVAYGVLLAIAAAFGAVMMLIASRIAPQLTPPGSPASPELMAAVFVVFGLLALPLAGLGIFWAIFFNRKAVRAQFLAESEVEVIEGRGVAAPAAFPLTIAIIAWLLVAGGALAIPTLLISYPFMLLGFTLHGWSARATGILIAAVELSAGTGLLRRRPEAHALTVGIFGFGLLNLAVTYLRPGAATRMQQYMTEISPGQPMPISLDAFLPLIAAVGLLFVGGMLWLLISKRQAYLAACAAFRKREPISR